jgi:hypothetical protein
VTTIWLEIVPLFVPGSKISRDCQVGLTSAPFVVREPHRLVEGAGVLEGRQRRVLAPTQVAHVDVDDIREAGVVLVPDVLEQARAGQGLTRVLHHELQQRKLARGEHDGSAGAVHRVSRGVEREVADLEHRRTFARSPPQQRA